MQIEKAPTLYFKEMVDAAIEHQKVRIDPNLEFYLVRLLSDFTNAEKLARFNHEPIAITLGTALSAEPGEQCVLLKEIGDTTLYVSGFFSDSLNRKVVDIDYYIKMGRIAYNHLAELMRDTKTALYGLYSELAQRFKALVDLLLEVSDRCKLTSGSDALRVYERWLRMKSRNSEEMLKKLGLIPLINLDHTIIH